jgi:hypothetical protein
MGAPGSSCENAWHAQRASTLPDRAEAVGVDFRARAISGPEARKAVADWTRLQLLLVTEEAVEQDALIARLLADGVEPACLFEEALRAGAEDLASRLLSRPGVVFDEGRSWRCEDDGDDLVTLGDVLLQFGSRSILEKAIHQEWFDPVSPVECHTLHLGDFSTYKNTWTPLGLACALGNMGAIQALLDVPGVRHDQTSLDEAFFLLVSPHSLEWPTGTRTLEHMPLPDAQCPTGDTVGEVLSVLLAAGARTDIPFEGRREFQDVSLTAGQVLFEEVVSCHKDEVFLMKARNTALLQLADHLDPSGWTSLRLPGPVGDWQRSNLFAQPCRPASPRALDLLLTRLSPDEGLAFVVQHSTPAIGHWPLHHWTATRGPLSMADIDVHLIAPLRDALARGRSPDHRVYDIGPGLLRWRGLTLGEMSRFIAPEEQWAWEKLVEGANLAKAAYDQAFEEVRKGRSNGLDEEGGDLQTAMAAKIALALLAPAHLPAVRPLRL